MGYAHYEITRKDGTTIEAGYAVDGPCEQPDCTNTTDRGLGSLCGEEPGGDEYGCGRYFCPDHLYGSPDGGSERCWEHRNNGA